LVAQTRGIISLAEWVVRWIPRYQSAAGAVAATAIYALGFLLARSLPASHVFVLGCTALLAFGVLRLTIACDGSRISGVIARISWVAVFIACAAAMPDILSQGKNGGTTP